MSGQEVSEEVVQRKLKDLLSIAEECITEKDLENLLRHKENFVLYDGFEPSGRIHIAQGVFKALLVNKCTKNGGHFIFWVADWFGLMNDKMGGDIEKIQTVGKYFIEVWKSAGMDMDHVEFRWAGEEINKQPRKYWSTVLDIGKKFTIARMSKCCKIMGRNDDSLTCAQILYPLMQCADIFFLKADICQLGLDQRKVNMLARDYCEVKKIKKKPIILSQHMISGLQQNQVKMSKSDPNSAIFMEDNYEQIKTKISSAYCPLEVKNKELNPILDYIEQICFNIEDFVFKACGKEFDTFEKLKVAFYNKDVTEEGIKSTLAEVLNERIKPVRDHFINNPEAKNLLELVEKYKKEVKAQGTCKKIKKVNIEIPDESKSKFYEQALVIFPIFSKLYLSLSEVLSVVDAIIQANLKQPDVINILIPDLSCVVHNAYGSDKKTKCEDIIKGVYDIFTSVIKSVFSSDVIKKELSTEIKGKLNFVFQSELMIADSSNYWICAINAGRSFKVSETLKALGYNPDDKNIPAGPIISSLMLVADVVTVRPKQLFVCEQLHSLFTAESTLNFMATQFTEVPDVSAFNFISTKLFDKETSDELLLTDTGAQSVKKIKRSFCEPGNVTFNPPLNLAKYFGVYLKGSIDVSKPYSSVDDITDDFKVEKIHPKDLKDSLSPLVKKFYSLFEQDLLSKKSDLGKKLAAFNRYVKRVSK